MNTGTLGSLCTPYSEGIPCQAENAVVFILSYRYNKNGRLECRYYGEKSEDKKKENDEGAVF